MSRFLERQGLLVRDDESAHLTLDAPDDGDLMHTLIGHSITYRIATGPRQGRKVLTLQTLPAIRLPGRSDARRVPCRDDMGALLEKKGIKVMARVTHSQAAAGVGIEMQPTELLIFGNPKLGSPLMQSQPTTQVVKSSASSVIYCKV